MKKRQRTDRKISQQPKAAKAAVPDRDAAKVSGGSSRSELEFKPIEIRGEPLSVTVLRDRR
jgi:hypothetical protein